MAVVAAIGVVVAVRGTSSAPPPTASTAPTAWVLPKLIGPGDVRLQDFRGRPVVVNFFASWCTACRGELPELAAVSRQLTGRVAFVGVDSLENGDGVAMARQYAVDSWPLARDVGGTQASGLHDALGGQGMPLTAVYDPSGKLVDVVFSAVSGDDLRATLHRLFPATA